MNAVDFLFEHSRESRADFIAGHSERLGIADLHDRVASLAAHLSREKEILLKRDLAMSQMHSAPDKHEK